MSDTYVTSAGAASADPSSRYLVREHHPEHGTMLGFWIYLMSDCLIFACLFATYAVLGRNYAGGPGGAELFDLKLIALNTAFLLFSSITYGFAMLSAKVKNKGGTLLWLGITGLFGLAFLVVTGPRWAVAAAAEQATANVQTVASASEELSSSIREISRCRPTKRLPKLKNSWPPSRMIFRRDAVLVSSISVKGVSTTRSP